MMDDERVEPVIDPTKNVLNLVEAESRRLDGVVEAAVRRQDDLRECESRHVREILGLRAEYTGELRRAETERIDAIRSVDVAAVNRAAEVSAQVATTLATQVATLAASTATAQASALEPFRLAIEDLRRSQWEAQGGKAETRETGVGVRAWVAIGITALIGFMTVSIGVAAIVVALIWTK